MRSKSPELMSEIKKYIEDYYLQNRQSPSTTKIAEAVGIARGTAYKYLVEMAQKNMIEYDGQEIRTNVTRKYSGEQTQTPIVGSIPCGSPQYEEENIEEYVSLPTAIFGKGDFFILRASGQSMIEAGIDDGDLVVVKKQVEAKEGDIVVALVDNQNTLKRYFRDDENKKIILHPENKKMKDIIVDECWFEEMVDFDTFAKSDFRAVKILACEAVAKSKKLLKFVLDDGERKDRVILSGIHDYYEPEELVGKTLIAITNLPPRAMMGIDSCGMLLSAIHEEEGEEKLHLLMVDDHIPAGAKLY